MNLINFMEDVILIHHRTLQYQDDKLGVASIQLGLLLHILVPGWLQSDFKRN